MENNLNLWDKLKIVPANRLKTIQAGRLRGKSDINPQWRYQVLTETFGPVGFGWKYTIDKQWLEHGDNGQIAAFVNISLFIKLNGEWSDAIPANGGSMFVENEKNGPHTSDEAFKMAATDALGTAAKMLGVAACVFLGENDTKYPTQPQQPQQPQKQASKPLISEKQWAALLDRVKGGDAAAMEAAQKAFTLGAEQVKALTDALPKSGIQSKVISEIPADLGDIPF